MYKAICLLVVVAGAVVLAEGGCSEAPNEPPAPAPPAKPVILDRELMTHLFSDNEVAVTLRNDGQDGWVVVSYRTTTTDTEIKRRSGAEVWVRHNLTSEDDSEYYLAQQTSTNGYWEWCTFMRAGEKKHFQLTMPGHSSWNTQDGPCVTPVLVKPEKIEVM